MQTFLQKNALLVPPYSEMVGVRASVNYSLLSELPSVEWKMRSWRES